MRYQAVLLDRDGVINFDSPRYILAADDFVPIPGSIEAIARLSRAGIRLAVVSNQSAVGRGWIDRDTMWSIHRRLAQMIEAAGGALAHVGYCPHAPEDGCDCRKPRPGLVREALSALDVTPEHALMIGDSARDLEAAAHCGVAGWLVASGCKDYRTQLRRARDVQPHLRSFVNLADAADALLTGR